MGKATPRPVNIRLSAKARITGKTWISSLDLSPKIMLFSQENPIRDYKLCLILNSNQNEKLGKLEINPEKLIKNNELKTLRGGYDGWVKCMDGKPALWRWPGRRLFIGKGGL